MKMRTLSLLLAVCVSSTMAAPAEPPIPDFMQSVVVRSPLPTPAAVETQNALSLDEAMFGIYDDALAVYQKNLLSTSPVILALFTGAGGNFILYRPGQPPLTADPVPVGYQIVKSISHSSMAIYQLIGRYTGNPTDPSWQGPMRTFRTQQQVVLDGAKNLDLPDEVRTAATDLLKANIAYMDECLKTGTFTTDGLEAFARGLQPMLQVTMGYAAKLQVGHWMKTMDAWKRLLGDDWKKTYGVTNSLYVTRTNNIFFTILAQYFGKDAINDRLLLLETTQFTTEPETMLNLLARIVADRALGKVFFKNYFLMDAELLSSVTRDATANEMSKRIPASAGAYTVFSARKAIMDQAKALGLDPLMPPLAPFHSSDWPWRTGASNGEGPSSMKQAMDGRQPEQDGSSEKETP